jgi:hypothetical protein
MTFIHYKVNRYFVNIFNWHVCLRRRSLLKVAYRNRNSDVTRFCHTRMRAHYVVGELCISRIVTLLPHLFSFRGVVHSYRTYSVLASCTTNVSDSNVAAAFNKKNIKKITSIFSDESTGSFICLRRHIYMPHVNKVQPIRVKMICIAAICLTCICVA